MELIDEVLECNRKIIENNKKLIEVNKEWAALAQNLLKLLIEERRKCTNGGSHNNPEEDYELHPW